MEKSEDLVDPHPEQIKFENARQGSQNMANPKPSVA